MMGNMPVSSELSLEGVLTESFQTGSSSSVTDFVTDVMSTAVNGRPAFVLAVSRGRRSALGSWCFPSEEFGSVPGPILVGVCWCSVKPAP